MSALPIPAFDAMGVQLAALRSAQAPLQNKRRALIDQKMCLAVGATDDAFSTDLSYREYVADALHFAASQWRKDEPERRGLYEYRYDAEAPADLLCFMEVDDGGGMYLERAYLGPFDVTELVFPIKKRIEEAAERHHYLETLRARTDNRIPSEAC
ncbi:hypothetical protein [Xenophilus sp. Marseille-Q4582]|uniref:hypothetical protein n=1 Tax=Xenophilus sp. Marseille-Q4582 TaxID=2866600 RepID=UPI001CE42BD7|nr:hypothetical protein [Xenophilus sp. Marseille-Q4582]